MAEEPTSKNIEAVDEPKTIADVMGTTDDAALNGVDVDVVAVLGTAELKIKQVLQLGRGAVVELDRLINEPVDVMAEHQLVAHGEVVILEDRLAVQISDIVPSNRPKQ